MLYQIVRESCRVEDEKHNADKEKTMITKDELNELRYLKNEIDEKEAELTALYTILEGTSSPLFSEEAGGDGLDILDIYDKIINKQRDINELCKEYFKEKERIKESASALSVEGQRLIRMRYFENQTWCDIAEKMAYTVRHLHRLHSTVLEELKKG